jgi:malonyl-CoA O-methyltransferase
VNPTAASHIANAFGRAAPRYDQAAHVQKQAAVQFASWLQTLILPPPNQVAEIGCGTGFLTEQLVRMWPNAPFWVSDIAPAMLTQAQQKVPHANVQWQVWDGQNGLPMPHDLVASSLCFQWFSDLPLALARLWSQTNTLAFSVVLADSFTAWRQAHQAAGQPIGLQPMPTWAAVQSACEGLHANHLHLQRISLHEVHVHPLDFAKSMKAIGAHVPQAQHAPQGLHSPLKKVLAQFEGPLHINYEIGLVCLRRQ